MKLDKLMCRLNQGDRNAFDEIYNDTKKAVYYSALSVLRERSLAEDVMQTTYLNIIKNSSSYQVGTNARAWILRIAKNEALNLLKKRSRENSVDEQDNVGLFGSYNIDDYGAVVDVARKNLAEDEFNILMLIAVSGYKRREIAEFLDMPISTVTWKYREAIKKMKVLITEK